MRRIKIFVTLVLLAMAVLFGAIDNRNQTLAADYSCRNTSNCPGQATCSGDRYAETGACAITCYKEAGNPAGLIVANGSANCAPPSPGGGGRPGGNLEDFDLTEGEYCAENWLWDFNCSGPEDTYRP